MCLLPLANIERLSAVRRREHMCSRKFGESRSVGCCDTIENHLIEAWQQVFVDINVVEIDACPRRGIYVNGEQVGYIAKESAKSYGPLAKLLHDKSKVGAARAFIRGGWIREGGDQGHYGMSPPEALIKTRKVADVLKEQEA